MFRSPHLILSILVLTACPGTEKDDSGTAATDSGTMDTGTMAYDCSQICATYGSAVPLVAQQIADSAEADPEFSADFAGLNADDTAEATFVANLSTFISDAYSCTQGSYAGKTMEDAHAGLAITSHAITAAIFFHRYFFPTNV